MQIRRTKAFEKQFKKLPKKIQNKFDERFLLFLREPTSPILKIHLLQAEKAGLVSMNVTADYRALFTWELDEVIFYEIETHSQLYS